jgi:hypothetical protein
MAIFLFLGSQDVEKVPADTKNFSYREMRSPFDGKWYAVKIPDSLHFAREPVPLYIPDVRERLDRELLVNTYWHSQTIYILKEYNQVISLIEPILKQNGVPRDFVYLAVAESGLQFNAVSPSGATGCWQFLEETGRRYGLQIDAEVDERLSYEKSTEAACRYLLEAKEKFGSWTLAAASFNMGIDGLQNAMRIQKEDSYYNLYLNRETSRYVFRILAFKEVLQDPRKYGFFLEAEDLYAPYQYKVITQSVSIPDLADFARQNQTTYRLLKLYNPWITNSSLTIKEGKSYELKIPVSEPPVDR